jgi:hypothetical protein
VSRVRWSIFRGASRILGTQLLQQVADSTGNTAQAVEQNGGKAGSETVESRCVKDPQCLQCQGARVLIGVRALCVLQQGGGPLNWGRVKLGPRD